MLPHPMAELFVPTDTTQPQPLRLVIRYGDLEIDASHKYPHTLLARPPFASIHPSNNIVDTQRTLSLFLSGGDSPMLHWARVNLTLTAKGLQGDTLAEYLPPVSETDAHYIFCLYEQQAAPINPEALPNREDLNERRAGFSMDDFAAAHSMVKVAELSLQSIELTPEREAVQVLAPLGTLDPTSIPRRGAPQYTPSF